MPTLNERKMLSSNEALKELKSKISAYFDITEAGLSCWCLQWVFRSDYTEHIVVIKQKIEI